MMNKEEFQKLHGFDNATMDRLQTIKDCFGGTIIKVVGTRAARDKWIPVPDEKRKENHDGK